MIYISPDNEYPRHPGDIMIDHPEWQIGDPLPEGWTEVAPGTIPDITDTQIWEEVEPALVDGTMTRQFTVRELTADELAQRELARIRNKVMNGEPLTADEAALLVGE